MPADVEVTDENGDTFRVYNATRGVINLDPFSDRQSVAHSVTPSESSSSQSLNVIPIQWVPSRKSDDTLARVLHSTRPNSNSAAARTLNDARANLFRPGQSPPSRPNRAPELDLRLDPMAASLHDQRSPGFSTAGNIRDSSLSDNSGAPSWLSGTSADLHVDAPKIMTSKQVQIGRLQQAEMVQFGGSGSKSHQLMEVLGANSRISPVDSLRSDPFNERSLTPTSDRDHSERGTLLAPGAISPGSHQTFGRHSDNSGQSSEQHSFRSLTPSSRSYDQAEEMRPDDQEFSAFRDSMSSQGTGRYLARPELGAVGQTAEGYRPHQPQYMRESVSSSKSAADSLLGAFPMIPPNQAGPRPPPLGLPQSSSHATLEHVAISRPPTSFRPLGNGTGPLPHSQRPTTAHSAADSYLETFPFVPPNMDDLAELPSAGLPTGMTDRERDGKGRNTLGMSTASEGLGGFDFSFDRPGEGDSPLPRR
jgi:hypothetical protein